MIRSECECVLDDNSTVQCSCGHAAFYTLCQRLWRTTSLVEGLEIMAMLGVRQGEQAPNPTDINDVSPSQSPVGTRHPRYTAYKVVWGTKGGTHAPAYYWCWSGEKGN